MTLNESIPVRREPNAGESAAGSELAWMGALVLVVILVFAVWAKLRGTGRGEAGDNHAQPATHWLTRLQGKSANALSVLRSSRLTPTHTLHEVEWQGRRLLVGCSSQSIQVLSEMPSAGQPSERALHRDGLEKDAHESA